MRLRLRSRHRIDSRYRAHHTAPPPRWSPGLATALVPRNSAANRCLIVVLFFSAKLRTQLRKHWLPENQSSSEPATHFAYDNTTKTYTAKSQQVLAEKYFRSFSPKSKCFAICPHDSKLSQRRTKSTFRWAWKY